MFIAVPRSATVLCSDPQQLSQLVDKLSYTPATGTSPTAARNFAPGFSVALDPFLLSCLSGSCPSHNSKSMRGCNTNSLEREGTYMSAKSTQYQAPFLILVHFLAI